MTSPIPVLDFAPFWEGDPIHQQAIGEKIVQVCHEIGFFYLSHHGVSTDQLDRLFRVSKQFFDLPLDKKNSVIRSPQTNCGYVGVEVESLNPARPPDPKEAFNIGINAIWPPNQEEFRQVVSEFYALTTQVISPQILRAFALGLGLPIHFFDAKHGENFFLRLLHYPALRQPGSTDQIRAGEHSDYGSITLLFQEHQEGSGGLEVQTRQGDWIPVPSIPGTVVVNVGDALQRWTNDHLRSTPHRVVNPQGEASYYSRYSVALFCDPNPDVDLVCLPQCQSETEPARYAPITAGDYIKSRFLATYGAG